MFNWLNFLSYALATAFTPGPNNIMSMSNAARVGVKKFWPFNFGIWTGCFALMVLCTVFCSTLSTLVPKIELPMKIIGAAYLLWLAWKIFRSSGEIEEKQFKTGYFSGVALQFMNPKLYLYGIFSVQIYILPAYQGNWPMLIAFAFLLSVISFISTVSWALFGSVFKLLFSKYARVTNTIMALLLVYCAVALFL